MKHPIRIIVWVALGLLSVACTARGLPAALPTPTAWPAATTAPAPTAPAPTAPAPTDRPTAIVVAATATPLTATPTPGPAVTEAVDDEEECRQACHTIDIHALFGLGAKHQPADHRGYTVCLECHATLPEPKLPATHLGRQDAACPLCHLLK